MADEIRITKHEDGSTTMVNVTAINAFIHDATTREAMRLLSHLGENPSYFSKGGTYENGEEEKIKNPEMG